MKTPSINGFTAAAAHRNRAFSFIELIIAIALTVVLMRGMYTIFDAATKLTVMTDEKMYVLLETAAVFDYLGDDFARCPPSDKQLFKIDTSTIVFKAMSRITPDAYVYIKYAFSGDKIIRSVYECDNENGSCNTPTDDDGDGIPDAGSSGQKVIAGKIASFTAGWNNSTDINNWSSGTADGTSNPVRAVKIEFEMTGATSATVVKEQQFTLMFPIMSM